MSDNSTQNGTQVIDEVIKIWRHYDPVEGYAAGLDDCKGKMFMPTKDGMADILRRIEEIEPRLIELKDNDLHKTAATLLNGIRIALRFSPPEAQIVACFLAIWYPLLKQEEQEPFVGELLKHAVEVVESEHSRLRDQEFNGPTRKACVDACASLDAILTTLASKNPGLVDPILELSASVDNFRSLFSFPVHDADSFDELFAFFESNAGSAKENTLYPQIIEKMFDYGASIEEIYAHGKGMLAEELQLTNELASRISKAVDLAPDTSLGEVYDAVTRRYEISGSVVKEAQRMMKVLNRFVDGNIEDLGVDPDLLPNATPSFLKALITSGAAISLNYLTKYPTVFVYVTEEKNSSWLTLLNVLVHEATHAYSTLILSRNREMPDLLKLHSWIPLPLFEATAFHRELELFESVQGGAQHKRVASAADVYDLLGLFDVPKFPLRDDILAFELETHIWRVIRALRTICDVEVNTGARTYPGFINWAAEHTQLSKELIHNECFFFLSYPGYVPSYSFCGSQYQELQREAKERDVSRLVFNTKANRMGLLPWTLCKERMKDFSPKIVD